MKMICPECIAQDQKSKVYPGIRTSTLVPNTPYYDEEGKYHNHDKNIYSVSFTCSNGHKWTHRTTGRCWCGWSNEDSLEEYISEIKNDCDCQPTI